MGWSLSASQPTEWPRGRILVHGCQRHQPALSSGEVVRKVWSRRRSTAHFCFAQLIILKDFSGVFLSCGWKELLLLLLEGDLSCLLKKF